MATTNRDRNVIETLGKGFNLGGWKEAEEELKCRAVQPQPKGSVTVEQFAKMTNRSLPTCRQILLDMKRAGLITSQTWKVGVRGTCNVYFLKKK